MKIWSVVLMHEESAEPVVEAFATQKAAYKYAARMVALWRPVLKKELVALSYYLEQNEKWDMLLDLFNSNETGARIMDKAVIRRVYVVETELKGHVME